LDGRGRKELKRVKNITWVPNPHLGRETKQPILEGGPKGTKNRKEFFWRNQGFSKRVRVWNLFLGFPN